jgi:hypothetical protein
LPDVPLLGCAFAEWCCRSDSELLQPKLIQFRLGRLELNLYCTISNIKQDNALLQPLHARFTIKFFLTLHFHCEDLVNLTDDRRVPSKNPYSLNKGFLANSG